MIALPMAKTIIMMTMGNNTLNVREMAGGTDAGMLICNLFDLDSWLKISPTRIPMMMATNSPWAPVHWVVI